MQKTDIWETFAFAYPCWALTRCTKLSKHTTKSSIWKVWHKNAVIRGGKCYCYFTCVTGGHSFFLRTHWKCSTRVGEEAPSVKLPPWWWRLRKWGTFSELFSVCKDHNLRCRCLRQDLSSSLDQLFFWSFPCKLVQTVGWTNAKHALNVTQWMPKQQKGGVKVEKQPHFLFLLFVHSTKSLRILPPLPITWLQQPADFYFHVWSCITPEVISSITPGRRTLRQMYFFFQN